MSSLDIPTSSSFYRPSPAVEFQSPSKLSSSVALGYSKSPLANSESRSLSNYYELKNTMEQRYLSDIDRFRTQAQEAGLRRDALEKENAKLVAELNFWRTKQVSAESNLDVEVQEQLRKNAIQQLKRSVGSQQELLNVEIESLRNQLFEKKKEVEQWRKEFFDQEVRTARSRATSESQLRSYEQQLNTLLGDIQEKINQAGDLQRDNLSLQSQTLKLSAVQNEVKDVRSLLDYNYEESQALKQDLTNQQIQNYQLRKSELQLKEQEQLLLTQVEIIQNKITQTNQLKEIEQERADNQNNQLLEKIKQDHLRVKDALDLKKLTYSQLIVEKEKNVSDLRSNIELVKDRIGRTRIRGSSSKKEADDWRLKHNITEQDRDLTVSRINAERERSVEALKRSHLSDKVALEGRISNLHTDLTVKEGQIRETSSNLNRSRIEKGTLELEKRVLQSQVDQKRVLGSEQERQQLLLIESKKLAQEREMEALRTSANYEKSQLNQQERTLSTVLDAKSREALDARSRANLYQVQSIDADRRAREKSIEADAWRSNYSRTDREKSIEVEAARNLRRSQVELAQRAHEVDMHLQDRNKATLLNVLDHKSAEVSVLHSTNSNLIGELVATSHEARRAGLESQVWRSKAELEERDRNNALLAKDIVQNAEISNLRRSQLLEGTVLRSEINNLNSHIDHKAREASGWRDNYNRLYSNTYNR